MSLKGKNLGVRTLSGVVLTVVVVGAALWSKWAFVALASVISVGVMAEFFRLAMHRNEVSPQQIFAQAVGVALIIESALNPSPVVLLSAIAIVPIFFIVEIFRRKTSPLENISTSLCGLAYAAVPMALLVMLGARSGEWQPFTVLSVIFIVWINDIFAYLVGCSIGRHRLCERISPKKSWEGFFGGVVFAVGFAMLFGWLMEQNIWIWAGLGAVVAVSGVFGDLVESMFKREYDVKDSGNAIPGHGGFMDRFDAMLLAAPFAYFYLLIFAL